MNSRWHLAQMNIAQARGPLDDPVMAGFVQKLDEINALADAAPGFVWRLHEHGLGGSDPVAQAYSAAGIIVNMSVWESFETLHHFVYHTAHGQLLRHRREWFERFEGRWSALWWVPAGHVPSVAEGRERLDSLREHDATAFAFNFQKPFAAAAP